MSASTVSITANPTARRRPVLASEKKSSVEVFVTDGAGPLSNSAAAVLADDKVTAGNGKDMSHHSIRGEAVLERSARDPIKKSVATSTISPRRTRKVVTKPEKPRWLTILSVVTKNFLLLMVLLGLVQMIRRLALKSTDGTVATNHLGFSEVEGRIADVESFLKTTTKMIQLQVEVVDRKIENEVGSLRREVNKEIEDRTAELKSDLSKLRAKGEDMERSLSELKAVDWLSKQEFDKIYEDLKAKSGESDERFASLDDIRAYARETIEREIEKHAADGLGRVDYALASGGAIVTLHSEPYAGKTDSWFSRRNWVHSDADKMLKPSFGEPGQCFPLKGSSGFVQIRLRTAIIPEAITLEHVAKSVAFDRSSAPKDCKVSAWYRGHDPELGADDDQRILLTEFSYDLEKSNAQTFDVPRTSSGLVDMIRFDFLSNHGSPSHTCIYRFRVHGHEPHSVSMMTKKS